jgi:[acyl-carrier-protein] S-malonyltransferase
MKALLFPGQGAQTIHMAGEILSVYPDAARLYDEAEKVVGLDLRQLTEADLAMTRYSQPAIVVHSVACLEKERAGNPDLVEAASATALAGFSLGEYTALYAAGLISFTDLLHLVNERARLMQAAAEKTPGAMYAILGLTDAQIEDCLKAIDDVYPVNYNCPGQVVIAGTEASAEKAAAELLGLGARRALRLAVNGAFHTPLMAEAARGIREFAKSISFKALAVPLYSNATASPVAAGTDFPEYLETHMISPVRFTDEVRRMRADGYDEFAEIGPGKVLTGLVKKI